MPILTFALSEQKQATTGITAWGESVLRYCTRLTEYVITDSESNGCSACLWDSEGDVASDIDIEAVDHSSDSDSRDVRARWMGRKEVFAQPMGVGRPDCG